jgi:hypothetical protein
MKPARNPPIAAEPKSEDRFDAAAAAPEFSMEGLIRDERGVRLAPESDD